MIGVPGGQFRASLVAWRSRHVEVGSFCIDPLEVSVSEYRSCVQSGGCSLPPSAPASGCTWDATDGSLPMSCVTFPEALRYCEWRGVRLPTELELEWAARGAVDGARHPWAGGPGSERACVGRPAPCRVGAHVEGASRQGVFDLLGNVAEWSTTTFVHGSVTFHVVRGGHFAEPTASAETWTVAEADARRSTIGFRCVATPEQSGG